LTIFGTNTPETNGYSISHPMLSEVETWTAIWWPVVSGILVPKIIKIRNPFQSYSR